MVQGKQLYAYHYLILKELQPRSSVVIYGRLLYLFTVVPVHIILVLKACAVLKKVLIVCYTVMSKKSTSAHIHIRLDVTLNASERGTQ